MLNEQIGHYRITGKLGQGGMGEIFSALDEKLNRTVAVKFIARTRMEGDLSRRWLRAAVRNGFPCLAAVENEPLFVTLREEPDYLTLIAELRATRDHFRGVFGELRDIVSAY